MRVQRARMQRHQGDEQEIGEGDAGHAHRQREFVGIGLEAGRHQRDEPRREGEGEPQQHELRDEQQRENLAGETLGLVGPLGRQHPRIGWHIGGVEGAFAEDRAELIGQPERHHERIVDRAGPEHGGEHQIAAKAGETRQQREGGDGEEAAIHQAEPESAARGVRGKPIVTLNPFAPLNPA